MPDTKITALTALTAADPANDVLPIVDVSDTTMAASGTTKKISINNVLGASGTATLASATISGAATVGTTLGVTGVATFAAGTALLPALTTTGDTNTGIYYPAADTFAVTTGGSERFRIDSSGNVGIGVTPSAWGGAYVKALQMNGGGSLVNNQSNDLHLGTNCYHNGTNWVYVSTNTASRYEQFNGGHYWLSAPSGTAGNAITGANEFVAKMQIDSSGNFIILPTNTPPTLSTNGQISINATSDTNLRFRYRGSDGVTRTADITLS